MSQSTDMVDITDELRDMYRRDGVVAVRSAFDDSWIDRLCTAIQRRMDAPGPLGTDFNTKPGDQRFFGDMFMWRDDADFRAAALDSPAAEIVATLMNSDRADFFYDQAFVKEPGASKPTPWHQDLPYWPIAGNQIASIWIALDEISLDSGAVEFVAGSHRSDVFYRPVPFGAPNSVNSSYGASDLVPVPDIEQDREDYEIVSHNLSPGDCLVFHARILHGAPGNQRTDRRRRGLALRYAGDDVRYDPREGTFPLPTDPGLAAGDKLTCSLFPNAWHRPN